jgi:plasmid stabilization system protein ParE
MAPMGRYVIFFRVLGDAVRIERVLRGARDLLTMIGQRGKGTPVVD